MVRFHTHANYIYNHHNILIDFDLIAQFTNLRSKMFSIKFEWKIGVAGKMLSVWFGCMFFSVSVHH